MDIFKADWFGHDDASSNPNDNEDDDKGGAPDVFSLQSRHRQNRLTTVFSVDIDCTGRRLASGGLDGSVRIWSLPTDTNTTTSQPSLLATMRRHEGAVLCVRWSPCGSFLASAADDCVIFIWRRFDEEKLLKGESADWYNPAFVGGGKEATFRVVQRLSEHTSDVNGLEWSPDGRWLVSCGLDGRVIVWRNDSVVGSTAFSIQERLEMPSSGAGLVKGIAWDPLGQHLIAQCDSGGGEGGSLVVWRVRDWKLETIVRPGDGSSQKTKAEESGEEDSQGSSSSFPPASMAEATFFCRPSWSPDGQLIGIAGTSNGMRPVVALASRHEDWSFSLSLVGHSAPIEVVRFSPRLYNSEDSAIIDVEERNENFNSNNASVCAVGSQDCSLSIWKGSCPRPLAVIDGIFEHSIMDIAWMPNGLGLVACSYDGSLALIKFANLLLGDPLGDEEMTQMMAHLQTTFGSVRGEQEVPTPIGIEAVKLQEFIAGIDCKLNETVEEAKLSRAKTITTEIPQQATLVAPKEQVETITVDGKRRIQPLSLLSASNVEAKPSNSKPAKIASTNADAPPTSPIFSPMPVLKRFSLGKDDSTATLNLELLPPVSPNLPWQLSCGGEGRRRWQVHLVAVDEDESAETILKPISILLAFPLIIAVFAEGRVLVLTMEGRRAFPPWILPKPAVAHVAASSWDPRSHQEPNSCLLFIVHTDGQFTIHDLRERRFVKRGSLSGIQRGDDNLVAGIANVILKDCIGSFRLVLTDGREYSFDGRLEMLMRVATEAQQKEPTPIGKTTVVWNDTAPFNPKSFAMQNEYVGINQALLPKDLLSLLQEMLIQDPSILQDRSLAYLEDRIAEAEAKHDAAEAHRWIPIYIYRLVREGMWGRAREIYGQLSDLNQSNTSSLPPLLAGHLNFERSRLVALLAPLLPAEILND